MSKQIKYALAGVVALFLAGQPQHVSGSEIAPGYVTWGDFAFAGLSNQNTVFLESSSYYFKDGDNEDDYNNTTSSPTSAVTDTHNPLGGLTEGGSPNAVASVYGMADGQNGQLHALAYASATQVGGGAQAFGQSTVTVGDTLSVPTATTIELAGSLDGLIDLVKFASAEYSIRIALLDPNNRDENGDYYVFGGFEEDVVSDNEIGTDGNQITNGPRGNVSIPFDVSVDVPAGDIFFGVQLYLDASAEADYHQGFDSGTSADDFSQTLNFDLTSVDGVPITSTGLVTVAPEPACISAVIASSLFFTRRRRDVVA